jgi:hypothetical protein
MTIKLKMGLKLKVLQKVRIKDNDYNRPGLGYLDPGTTLEIISSPTRLADVPFKIIQGSGKYTSRGLCQDREYNIKDASGGFFFSQGHTTKAPYDWGTLDAQYYEIIG